MKHHNQSWLWIHLQVRWWYWGDSMTAKAAKTSFKKDFTFDHTWSRLFSLDQLSNVGELYWTWIPKNHIRQSSERERKICLHLFTSTSSRKSEIRKLPARSIQPKFPEISVQNSLDRFGPTGKVSKKRVHLLKWTTFPGRTGWNFGWMDRALQL